MASKGARGGGRGGWPRGGPASAFEDAARGDRGWGLRKADLAVVAAAALVALAALAALAAGRAGAPSAGAGEGGGLVAVVQNTDGFYRVLPLAEDATVVVASPLGTNTIEVSGGRVRCSEADCANQVCVETGWVSREGQQIVCLPHELTVQVVADPADAAELS